MSKPFSSAWGMAARGSLCKRAPGGRQLLRSAGFEEAVKGEHAEVEVVDRGLTDDGVAGHAGLAAADRDLAGGLALQRLLVEATFARDDERGRAHLLVEPERVEHEVRTGNEGGVAVRIEATGEPAAGAGHREATRVARRLGGEGVEAAAQSLDGVRISPLLRAEDLGGTLERRADVADDRDRRIDAGFAEGGKRAGAGIGGCSAADRDEHVLSPGIDRCDDQLPGPAG